MNADTETAQTSDDIEGTVDYAAVAQKITNLGSAERKTIEKFAGDIADMILDEFNVENVEVTISKRILPNTESVSVTICRP